MLAESLRTEQGFSFAVYRTLLHPANTASMEAMFNSILVSLLSVLFSCMVGTLFAVVFTQWTFPLRDVLSKLAVIPLALPPLVGVIAFLFVFGESGMLSRIVREALGLSQAPFALEGIPAIVAVHTYSFYVYFYLFVSNALRQLDASLIEAAETLGSSRFTTLRRIVLPELKPALLGASILTFMTSMASFSAPLLFGGERRFLTLQIYNAKLNGEMDVAAAVSVVLALVSVLFFLVLKWMIEERASGRGTKGAARRGILPLGSGTRRALLTIVLVFLVLEMLPLLSIILISFAREGSWTWQIVPQAYTTENYTKLFSDEAVFRPMYNSVTMSVLTVAATLIVGTSVAYLITKGPLRRQRLLFDALATLPYAVPGTVIAISLILAFNTPTVFTGGEVLVGTFIILPLAYFIKMFPLVVRSTSAALTQVDDSVLEAAETFGAGTMHRLRKVLVPLIWPGIVSGGLLVMITALGEFVSSILLYTYSNRPISVEILAQMRTYNFGAAAAYSVLLLVLILLLTAVAQRLSKNREGAFTI
jgi:iron(III) transport system permease protein